ncbi:MAG: aminotransferase class I/II-fold pyridoxal phosphate-dependent enzyme [Candidatus Omnitrophica bacterium]|nr:aminotransferase class I/II-fold pyridoxal phosphate-dependent enzyme [Candidatus Omnitrophota bacterium]
MLNDVATKPTQQNQKLETNYNIPVFRPSYGEEEVEAIRDCLQRGWTGTGPKVKEFEERFAKYVGVQYAIATNSGTGSLHLALKVAGVEGREVITTPLTFVSTNHAILYNAGIPVFADIDPETLNLDPVSVESLVTKRTKAILAVHYGGTPCSMDRILSIAKRHNLLVIEDAAHGCGGEYQGKKLGALGDIGCFSFHAVKNLSVGDGGMITTNSKEVYERLVKLRWMGISKETWSRTSHEEGRYSWWYDVDEIGFRYGMNDVMASMGLVQLKKLDALNEKRRRITEKYNRAFRDLDWVETPSNVPNAKSACHNYVIKVDNRDQLCEYLKEKGVSTGVHYRPNYHYPMYKTCKFVSPVCEKVWKRILTLPLFPDLSENESDFVIDLVRNFQGREPEMEFQSSCVLCRQTETVKLFDRKEKYGISKNPFSVVKCTSCGLACVNPRPTEKKIGRFYPETYSWKEEEASEGKKLNVMERLEKFYRFHLLRYETGKVIKRYGRTSGRVLDVGCGTGDRLQVFKEKGFDVYGVETAGSVDYAKRRLGPNLFRGTLHQANYSKNSFDIITLYNVLEHLHDSRSVLGEIHRILKKDGLLVIEVPNFDSIQSHFFKSHWAAFDVPRDLYYFTPTALKKLVDDAGFTVNEIDFMNNWWHPPTLVVSAFPALDPQLIWHKQKQGFSTAHLSLLWGVVTCLCAPFAFIESLFKRSALMTLYASKK